MNTTEFNGTLFDNGRVQEVNPNGQEPTAMAPAEFLRLTMRLMEELSPGLAQWEQTIHQNHQAQQSVHHEIRGSFLRSLDLLQEIGNRIVRLEKHLDLLSKETVLHANALSQLQSVDQTIAFNIDQVRSLTENLVRKNEQLVDDFIARYVVDPLCKEFVRVQFALKELSKTPNLSLSEEVAAHSEAIRRFLEGFDLRIIQPQPGDTLELREHHPIQVVPITDANLDGKIAATINPGLSRPVRVVQQARVAVYKISPLNQQTNEPS